MNRNWILFVLFISPLTFSQVRNPVSRESEAEEPLPAGPDLMQEVRAQLPPMPLLLTGTVRTRQNRKQQDHRLVSELRFGDPVPTATYTLSDLFGDVITKVQVRWPEGTPEFFQWDAEGNALPVPSPQDEVADTGLTWSDLALDFLWWPDAESEGRDLIKSRSAVIVQLPAPPERDDVSSVKLWVDERAGFIVRAELLDEKGELLKRIEVDSIKKVREDLWMIKDLKIYDRSTRSHIGIRFQEVVELEDK